MKIVLSWIKSVLIHGMIMRYSKEDQLRNNKAKEKKIPFGQRPSKGKFGLKKSHIQKKSKKSLATDEDRKYLQWFKEQGFSCMICGSLETESHHVKEFSSDKKNHKELLPLCREHHTGKKLSPHGTSRLFRKHYPIEKQREIASGYYKEYLGEKI